MKERAARKSPGTPGSGDGTSTVASKRSNKSFLGFFSRKTNKKKNALNAESPLRPNGRASASPPRQKYPRLPGGAAPDLVSYPLNDFDPSSGRPEDDPSSINVNSRAYGNTNNTQSGGNNSPYDEHKLLLQQKYGAAGTPSYAPPPPLVNRAALALLNNTSDTTVGTGTSASNRHYPHAPAQHLQRAGSNVKSGKNAPGTPVRGPKTAWLCRTARFQQLCDNVFDTIDTDKSGNVDEKELYVGLLLIHLKLGMYLGPAACKPLSRERCQHIFATLDLDRSGSLDRAEFQHAMMVLFGNVLFRVIVQWSMTITIVPLVAKHVCDGAYRLIQYLVYILSTMDERSYMVKYAEQVVKYVWVQLLLHYLSGPILFILSELQELPESVYRSMALALITILLGILVVPYIIFKIDDFFQWLANLVPKRWSSTPPPATRSK